MKIQIRPSSPMLLVLSLLLVACGRITPEPVVIVVTPPPPQTARSTPTPLPTVPPQTGVEILQATFAHGLSAEMQAVDPSSDFLPAEPVYLSLQIKGRPKEGLIVSRFFWHDTFIAEAGVDLGEVNSSVLFAAGNDTYAGYTLTHQEPFPLSDGYRADVSYGDVLLGSYPFRIVAPEGAIPSQISNATLALGADEQYNPIEPSVTFAFDEVVYLVGRGDLGISSWIQADWYVAGQLDSAGSRSLTMDENATGLGFAFSYMPEGGWPPGEHYAILRMNDQEIGKYPFTILSSGGAAPLVESAFWDAFPLPQDAEILAVTEGYDMGFASIYPEPQILETYAGWFRDQGWQEQAPTEAMTTKPHKTWIKDGAQLLLEIQGLDDKGRTVVWLQLETEPGY